MTRSLGFQVECSRWNCSQYTTNLPINFGNLCLEVVLKDGEGRIGSQAAILDRLRAFYEHRDWRCRQETVHALDRLLQRGVVDVEAVMGDVDRILPTSPNFEPSFPLKDSLESLARRIHDRRDTN